MQWQAVMDVPFVSSQRTLRDAKLYLFGLAFVAGNLLLPMAVHAIPQGGLIFLPLFLFTLVAGYSEGLEAGILVAVASPLINHALTGMPVLAMLPTILFKSILLAVAAAIVSIRLEKISLAAIIGLVLGMQVLGGIFEFAISGDAVRALYALKLGIPGMILMSAGGYVLLRMIANLRKEGELKPMIYRTLAGEKVSQLGFGAMRLPMVGPDVIDEKEAIRMMRFCLDSGVNYIDTAWVYHGGQSELIVAKALKDGYRKKTFVATKCPIWDVKSEAGYEEFCDKQREKLGVDCIDFYLLHAFNQGTWDNTLKFNGIAACEKLKKAGKIRHFGFSFHDAHPVFMKIIDAYKWEFCQIQYNYLDRKEQAGLEGFQRAKANGTDVIVMEPLRGGNLVSPIPPKVEELWKSAPVKRDSVEWALGWVFSHPDVSTVLSGMSSMAQVEQNLAIASKIGAGSFTPAEMALIDKTEELYRGAFQNNCTECGYCVPCPQGVNIPRNFKLWNELHMFGKSRGAADAWKWFEAPQRGDKCTRCEECLSKCPQLLPIPDDLEKVVADFVVK